jgi:drug/metabolite transporter superfamily protein YnfA
VPAVLLTGTGLSPARQLRLVAVAVGGIGLAMTLLLVNAFRSRPLDRLDPASLAALALCGVAVIAVYAITILRWLRGGPARPSMTG